MWRLWIQRWRMILTKFSTLLDYLTVQYNMLLAIQITQTDSSSFTNLSAKIRSGDIAFSELNLFRIKAQFQDHILSASSQSIPDHIHKLHCKKLNINNARASKVEKLQLPSDFRSTIAASFSEESHFSNFKAEVCVDEKTYCTLCFLSSNRMFHLHKRQKRIMDVDKSIFRARELVDDQK